ncbi:MAG: hypothetical protein A2161_06615 [Candidatus Schekmanbacteria bacterium RBG_13_48_7]|uniref:DUF4013 domain-containing protein n=1 Tax=Candidatus Schekmanbacteria bacterium RBG_13_48_7 TaxID=1817878 RepID=A0A1F7RTT9_9BACT|nr:MAG: hypothetical protein A2161_06615 [Candidatus Schekmanbacteria bacterium RBG_13_48_7]
MTTLRESLQIPFQDSQWALKLFLGGLFLCLPVFNFFAIGYLVNYFAKFLRQEQISKLPGWSENIGSNFGRGIIVFFLFLIYLIAPAAILALGVFLVVKHLSGILGIILIIFSIILLLLIFVFFPLSVVNYLVENQISSAFHIRKIYDDLQPIFKDYLKIYFAMWAINILVSGSPFFLFYISLGCSREMGKIFAGVIDTSVKPDVS